MLMCKKCEGRVMVDRAYSSMDHIETYCIRCGERKFFHPPTATGEGMWILQKEILRSKNTITPL